MASVLRAASGIVSRCGSNAPLRAFAAAAVMAVTWWAGWRLWAWTADCSGDGKHVLAIIVSMACIIGSLVNMFAMMDPPRKWTLERMTSYAPFMVWRSVISDGRVTAWKLLLWPLLVPAEALTCLWLSIGWLIRLLDIDLSK